MVKWHVTTFSYYPSMEPWSGHKLLVEDPGFKAATVNVFLLTLNQMKRSLLVANPKKIISQLCRSPQLDAAL